MYAELIITVIYLFISNKILNLSNILLGLL